MSVKKRVKRSYYTRGFNSDGHVVMSKYNEYLEHQTDYEMVSAGQDYICGCPARVENCRHKKMQLILADAMCGDDLVYNGVRSQLEDPNEKIYLDWRKDGQYYWVTKSILDENFGQEKKHETGK